MRFFYILSVVLTLAGCSQPVGPGQAAGPAGGQNNPVGQAGMPGLLTLSLERFSGAEYTSFKNLLNHSGGHDAWVKHEQQVYRRSGRTLMWFRTEPVSASSAERVVHLKLARPDLEMFTGQAGGAAGADGDVEMGGTLNCPVNHSHTGLGMLNRRLPAGYSGRIYFCLSGSQPGPFMLSTSVVTAEWPVFIEWLWDTTALKVWGSLLLLFLALISFLSAFFHQRVNLFFGTGVFMLVTGSWLLSRQELTLLASPAAGFWRAVELVTFFMVPWSFTLCLIGLFQPRFRFIYYMFAVQLAFSLFTLVAGPLSAGGFETYLDTGRVVVVVSIPLWLWHVVASHSGRRSDSIILGAALLMAFGGIHDILMFSGVIHTSVELVYYFVFLFCLSLVYKTAERFFESYRHWAASRESNQRLNEFLNYISHELRTPLNTIMQASELAGMSGSEIKPPATLDTIRKASGRLLDIVNHIFAFSRLHDEQATARNEFFEPHHLAVKLKSAFQNEVNDRLTIDERLPQPAEQAGLVYRGPGQLVSEILVQLVRLGLLSSPADTAVRVSIEGGHKLHFTVEFTGRVKAREKNSGRQSRAALHQTSGHYQNADFNQNADLHEPLSLPLLELLVEKSGGRLQLEEKGNHSRIWFALPAEPVNPGSRSSGPVPPVEATKAGGADGHVMIVDDNVLNANILARVLERNSISATALPGGQDALDSLRRAVEDGSEPLPTVMFIDLRMNNMDGIELARNVLALFHSWQRPRPRMVALTGDSDTTYYTEWQSLKLEGFLQKPASLEEMMVFIHAEKNGR